MNELWIISLILCLYLLFGFFFAFQIETLSLPLFTNFISSSDSLHKSKWWCSTTIGPRRSIESSYLIDRFHQWSGQYCLNKSAKIRREKLFQRLLLMLKARWKNDSINFLCYQKGYQNRPKVLNVFFFCS